MKRFFILLAVMIVLLGAAVVAEEAVMIDFAELAADYPADDPLNNQATLVDYSTAAGSSFTDEDKALMKTSLAIENWEVLLNSSARSIENASMSEIREAKVKDDAARFAGDTIMGVRVHFPDEPFNAWALIRPPFEIPAYADKTEVAADGTLSVPQEELGRAQKFDNYGVVKNVGVLKSIELNAFGRNFPQRISLVLQDQNNDVQEIVMGDFLVDGWKTYTVNNPNYIQEVRNRELRTYPLYPKGMPFLKLIGIRIYKDAAMEGSDFIAYIKDVKIKFDKAVLSLGEDIDDEGTWGILQQREEARRNAELSRLGNLQVLRYLETKKMHQESAAAEE